MKDDSKKLPMTRGTRRRERTRADLLAAARKVFAQRGYHDASILDITREADVGVGTFYLHFRDKDEAFATLIDEVIALVKEQAVAEMRGQTRPSLTLIIEVILRHAYEERDLFRIALTGDGQVTRTIRVEDMMAKGFTDIFEKAETQQLLQGYDIPLLARLVTGVLAQGIAWWFDQDEPGPEKMTEQIITFLSHGLPEALF
jgi:AcrR family transcriptional regulator